MSTPSTPPPPPSQESPISGWLQFSDGSASPLDNYGTSRFTLSAVSLDERVVSVVWGGGQWAWPAVVARGDGQGHLVQVELRPPGECLVAGPHPPSIANGTLSVSVKVEQQREPVASGSSRYSGSALSVESDPMEEGVGLPKGVGPRQSGLVELEAGVYAMVGVLGLALLGVALLGLVLLVLLPLALKHRPPGRAYTPHWEEGLHLQQDELPGSGDCGGQRGSGRGQLSSPTTERNRVQFTTFSLGNVACSSPAPALSPIQWVCPDMELQEPEALRTFMEQLDNKLG